jgi:hypothetical protein
VQEALHAEKKTEQKQHISALLMEKVRNLFRTNAKSRIALSLDENS